MTLFCVLVLEGYFLSTVVNSQNRVIFILYFLRCQNKGVIPLGEGIRYMHL